MKKYQYGLISITVIIVSAIIIFATFSKISHDRKVNLIAERNPIGQDYVYLGITGYWWSPDVLVIYQDGTYYYMRLSSKDSPNWENDYKYTNETECVNVLVDINYALGDFNLLIENWNYSFEDFNNAYDPEGKFFVNIAEKGIVNNMTSIDELFNKSERVNEFSNYSKYYFIFEAHDLPWWTIGIGSGNISHNVTAYGTYDESISSFGKYYEPMQTLLEEISDNEYPNF